MYRQLRRPVLPLLLAVFLAWAVVPAAVRAAARCFPETGQCVDGRIREFWEQNGGLPVFGFPIGPQHEEMVEGRPVQVQWFERNRLELHPENARPYDVLLGRLGADRLQQQGRDWFAFAKSAPQPGCRFFAETGHNVCGAILRAWRASGLEFDGRRGTSEAESLGLFGLPLSDPQAEDTPNGRFTVQWFERARFELHPENAPLADVLLGLLGREVQSGAPPSAGAPPGSSAPAGDCDPIAPPVSAAIRPGACVKAGDALAIDVYGFQPHERVSFWLTGPDGSASRAGQRESGGDGAIGNFAVDTTGLYSGAWFWVFEGAASKHQAIVHFQVYGSGLQTPPPAIPNPTIDWGSPRAVSSRRQRGVFPSAVVDGANHTHIVYSSDEDGLMYVNDISGFGDPQPLDAQLGANREPFFTLALGPGNTLHVVYARLGGDRHVYYRQATLSGSTANWSPPERISDGERAFAANLAVDGNNTAHIVWIEQSCNNTYNVVYRARYADGHLSEASKPRGDCVHQNRPQIALTGDGTVHIVFQHDRDIFYARREGAGWATGKLSPNHRNPSYNPTIATDGAALYVAWDESINNHDILFRRSPDGGRSWSEIVGLSDTSSFASFPKLAYAPATRQVYAVWSDVKNLKKNPYVVFVAYDPQSGAASKVRRLSTLSGASIHPVVGVGPGVVTVAWQDHTLPGWRIYRAGGIIGSAP